jgi:hypothetical protein
MTRTNFALFVVTALVLCVLLGLKASLRHAALVPPATATAAKATTIVPVKPDARTVPAPAVSVPLAVEPRNVTVVPVKPAPTTDPRISTIYIAPRLGAPAGRGPDGQ